MRNHVTFFRYTLTLILAILPGFSIAAEWSDGEIDSMAIRAEKTVRKAFDFLWEYRQKLDMDDVGRDPDRTGVIGIEFSPITTTMGYEDAKELSTKPGWAAWLVRDLAKRGIWHRADIAASFSGSFPALNIAVLAALQELGVEVRSISSVGASSWGANEPGLTWLEMERLLREEGILKVGSSAATLGGTGDKGLEWNDYARELALESVRRSRLPLLSPLNLRDAVKKRMRFYGSTDDYVCFINVGGGHAVMGGGPAIRFNRGGWYFQPPEKQGHPNGVMDNFLRAGVPCLNFLYLESFNEREKIVTQ